MAAFPDKNLNYREHPEEYRIGRGEQGVLTVEPYKSEILLHWRFKTEQEASASAAAILALYRAYTAADDFVGMDMARKFLQMGYTRSRRYARHRSGRKYDDRGIELALAPDTEKAKAAAVFKQALDEVRQDPEYVRRKQEHQRQVRQANKATATK
jgi:hypothetical protein